MPFVPRGIGDLENQGLWRLSGAHPKHADGIETQAKITGLGEKPCPRRGREGEALENQLPEAIGKATTGHLLQIIRFPKRRQRGAV
jgi:hypothetical protein